MEELSRILLLSNYFVQFLLIIILIGILIIEFSRRRSGKRDGILYFIVHIFLVLILNILSTIKIFDVNMFESTMVFMQILNPITTLFFIFIVYKFWNDLNKKIVTLIILNALILGFFILSNHLALAGIKGTITAFFSVTITTLLYFLIIDFLIKTSRGYKKKNG